MIIKFEGTDFSEIKEHLNKILNEESGLIVEEIKKGHWEIIERKTKRKLVLLKANAFHRYFDIKKADSSPSPNYTLIDEENLKMNFILVRSQAQSGTTYQKLPYGEFALKDYKKQYSASIKKYDHEVSFILNKYYEDYPNKYEELLNYLNEKNFNTWVMKIKLF